MVTTARPPVLDGLKVVDLSWGSAGPVTTMLLGDYGAEVVKVEPPGGDPFRATPGYTVWNRNKQSVILDLHDDADRADEHDRRGDDEHRGVHQSSSSGASASAGLSSAAGCAGSGARTP